MPPEFDNLQSRMRLKQAKELLDQRTVHLDQERRLTVHLSNDVDWGLELGNKQPHVTSRNVRLQRSYLK